MEEKAKQLNDIINQLDSKEFALYFYVMDTLGNPVASIANIYEHVSVLNDLGYTAKILHDKNDYHDVTSWLGKKYAALPHVSIETQELIIKPSDFIIIPEIFSNVMDQVKTFPCNKVVFSQNYAYALELLPIGKSWKDFGFNTAITTSEKQAEFLKNHFYSLKTHVVPVSIPSYFKPTDGLQSPIVSIVTRNQADALKIIKSFYLQYPMYKWVTFKELRNLPRTLFADELRDSCLAIWHDRPASFGTFPVEAIESGVPVIGLIPDLIPEWMENRSEEGVSLKNNGVWVENELLFPEMIATFIKGWLEDSLPESLYNEIKESTGKYTEEAQVAKIAEVYGQLVGDVRVELRNQIEKLQKQEA